MIAGAALFEVAAVLENYDRALARESVGRPPVSATKLERVRAALTDGHGIRPTARKCSVGVATVYHVRQQMTASSSIAG
ncbi:MAG: hypothetical protein ACREFY_10495 [Acetobacteraceae bacterium]